MNKIIIPKFVDSFPDNLEEGILYISLRFNTAVHLCACGCGMETITKLAPKEWCMTYNGQNVSLYPSIGNWNFKCRSHYWVRDGRAIFITDSRKNIKVELRNERKKKRRKKKLIPLIKNFIIKKKK